MKIKKKLRDITTSEFEDWAKKRCGANSSFCANCYFKFVHCLANSVTVWTKHKNLYSDNFLDQEIEIETDILSEKEKEYLKSIIRPFKDRVVSIEKGKNINSDGTFYYIGIIVKYIAIDRFSEAIYLPYFKPESKMYEGMELNKEYTLKELGL